MLIQNTSMVFGFDLTNVKNVHLYQPGAPFVYIDELEYGQLIISS